LPIADWIASREANNGRMRIRSEAHPRALHYDTNREYVLGTLRRRCPWLDDGDREGMFHEAFLVLLDKEERGVLDVGEMAPHQIRAYLTQTALNKALDEGKRAGRQRSVELKEDGAYPDERSAVAEERVDDQADRARVREIIDELPNRQQAIVKLRFFLQRTPAEIQDFLDITERSYRRDLERAMRTIAKGFELLQAGEYCESRRSLILAFVAGIAGPNRMAAAKQHLATCRACAAWAANLRTAGEQVAVAVPMPAVLGATSVVGDGPLAGVLDRVSGMIESVKHQATSLVVRGDTAAQYAASVRPGGVAAAVVGCLAVTSGASYCAIEGLPFQTPLTRHEKKEPPKPKQAATPAAARTALPRDPGASTASTATSAPSTTTRPSSTTSTAASRKAAAVARVKRRQQRAAEFTFEGSGTTGGSTKASAASTTSPPAAPPPPPASSGGSQKWGNEFSP
jgi:RNA polymerase sigma factor (sigma-70 family)